jgi:hypothetical protein
LEPDTATMNLQDFFAHYSTPSNAPMYLQNVPTIWKHYQKQAKNSPFICLEMYIDIATVRTAGDSFPLDIDELMCPTDEQTT